ncbi:DUF4330 domain-containing protein [Salinarchaeum chitinilyticum]
MELLDDEGNLFGVVNVVDALVVLLILAVVVAGLAVVGVFGGEEGESATRYATVDLGEQPGYVAQAITEGDRMVLANGQNVTVTDVYRAPTAGGTNPDRAHVLVQTRVSGTLTEADGRDDPVFQFGGDRMRVGSQLALDTSEYTVKGTVAGMSQSTASLPTTESQVVIESDVTERMASTIQPGDEYVLAGETIATVETVRSYAADGDRRRVQLGVTLAAIEQHGQSLFGMRPLAIDTRIGVYTSSYGLNGTIIHRGGLEPPGETTTTGVELELSNVPPDRVGGLSAGMTETERGRTHATIQSIDTEPAEIILESDDGNVYAREHPTNVDVTIEADLETRDTGVGLQFHGEPLQQGRTVTLDFGTVEIDAVVAAVDAS